MLGHLCPPQPTPGRNLALALPLSARAAVRVSSGGLRFWILALAWASLLWVSPARAESYEQALARGVAARDRAQETELPGDWQRALEGFGEALQQNPTKEARFEWAAAAAQLHLDDEAFAAYEQALAQGLSGRAAQLAKAFLDAHATEMARLALAGPAGAEVFVRGRRRGVLPLAEPLVVSAGSVPLAVRLAGHRAFERELELARQETTSLEVELLEANAPVEAAPAKPEPIQTPPQEPRAPLVIRREGPPAWALPTAIGAGALVLAGASAVVVSSLRLPGERETLEANCAVEPEGDQCDRAANPEERDRAQTAADDIATLKAVRWGGVAGLGVGVVVGTLAVVTLTTSGNETQIGVSFERGPALSVRRSF